MDWTSLVQCRDQWQVLVNKAFNDEDYRVVPREPPELHGTATQKTAIFIVNAVKAPNLRLIFCVS